MDVACKKARDFNIDWRKDQKLNFITQKFDQIEKFKARLNKPLKLSVTNSSINEYVQEVPENYLLEEMKARDYLSSMIDKIVDQQSNLLKQKRAKVSASIVIDARKLDDYKVLNESFVNWSKNPTSEKHMKNVDKEISKMKTEFDNCQSLFTSELDTMRKFEVNITGDITVARELLKDIWHTTFLAENLSLEMLRKAGLQLKFIHIAQNALGEMLDYMYKRILQDYNKKRIVWVQFIIGMRKSLNPKEKPKPVKLVKK